MPDVVPQDVVGRRRLTHPFGAGWWAGTMTLVRGRAAHSGQRVRRGRLMRFCELTRGLRPPPQRLLAVHAVVYASLAWAASSASLSTCQGAGQELAGDCHGGSLLAATVRAARIDVDVVGAATASSPSRKPPPQRPTWSKAVTSARSSPVTDAQASTSGRPTAAGYSRSHACPAAAESCEPTPRVPGWLAQLTSLCNRPGARSRRAPSAPE